MLAAVAAFSLFVATIPGEPLDRCAHRAGGQTRGGRYLFGYAVPACGAAADGSLLGLFHRNLNVTDTTWWSTRTCTPGEPSLNLRGRDLRYRQARPHRPAPGRPDGRQPRRREPGRAPTCAASWLQCADLDEMLLTDNRRAARCASARGANFSKARLADAKMAGIDLRGARLEEAQLRAPSSPHAADAGASFAGARLDRADLSGGAALQGANFLLASLQGADLAGAKLQMADFTSAALQGANLSLAGLEGAMLRDAELEGASLQHGAAARRRPGRRQAAGQPT